MTYEQWFSSQQGIPYDSSWLFAKAAWEHQQRRIEELQAQVAYLRDFIFDEEQIAFIKWEERERCAAVCERLISGDGICADNEVWIHDCAEAIRSLEDV